MELCEGTSISMVKCKTIDIEVPATAELVTSRKKQSGNNTPKGFALMILGLWSNNSLETYINTSYIVSLVAWCRVCKVRFASCGKTRMQYSFWKDEGLSIF